MFPQRKRDVIKNGEIAQKSATLKEHPHPLTEFIKRFERELMNILAIHPNGASFRLELTPDQLEQSGLTGATRPHDGCNLTSLDIEIQIVEYSSLTPSKRQVSDRNQHVIAGRLITHTYVRKWIRSGWERPCILASRGVSVNQSDFVDPGPRVIRSHRFTLIISRLL